MKAGQPFTHCTRWQKPGLFNIDFASYTLAHHSFPKHFHDHFVIELVISGADKFYCDGSTYTAEANQLVLINPGEIHTGSTVAGKPLHYFSFYPDQKMISAIAVALQISAGSVTHFDSKLPAYSRATGLMYSLYQSFTNGTDVMEQESIFYDCMMELLQPGSAADSIGETSKDKRVITLIDYFHYNFKKEISLADMSALVNLNPCHMIRLFKKQTGLSPYDYLVNVRTEYAKQLLLKGYKVHDAATSAGFYDSSHLNRSFIKFAGTSPKSFLLSKGQYCTTFMR